MKPIVPFVLLLAAGAAAQSPAVSTYGHARARALAELGKLPAPADIVVADIVNYHRHRLPLPRAGDAVGLDVRLDRAPGDPDRLILQVGYTTAPADDRSDVPPVHLALVLDCSGSMHAAGKMDRLQAALRTFAAQLRADDRVTLVTYSDEAEVRQQGRRVGDGDWLRREITALQPGGSTNLHAGLMAGLRALAGDADGPPSRRVILLTDGIANRGETDPQRILAEARTYTDEQIDLSTIGLGTDLNSALLEQLARGARGLFHFVADAKDIDEVFHQESESLLAAVARRPLLSVTLPPDVRFDGAIGHDARETADGFAVSLPDLNAAVTAVVLARLQRCGRGGDDEPLRVQARLDYRAAANDRRRSVEVAENLTLDPRRQPLRDAELRKNYTIAVLAEGMQAMAAAAAGSRWAAADGELGRALQFAREQFPSVEDQDVRRVLDMAEDYRRTLGRYLDRFRDY